MNVLIASAIRRGIEQAQKLRLSRSILPVIASLTVSPAAALAQSGSPFDSGFTSLQNLFTGTIAKVASLIAIVIGGYMFAHGEPGAKNSRFGYVSISRASHEATIFTDNLSKLTPQLSTDISKTSALEINQALSIKHGVGMGI